jgi:non-specific serine/threonine protein kinase
MRAAIAWSYELLDPAEQALIQQLAVFVGGFTLDAAETVSRAGDSSAGDVLAGVAALVDSSLLSRVELPSGALRFVMLETIREYALEQLAVSDREQAAHRRHADWCLSLATQAEQRAFGPDDVDALNRLEVEYDNIRHALSWALDRGQIESGMRLACLAWPFWMFRSYFSEGRAWMERLIERAEPPPTSTYVMTLNLLGILCEALGDFEIALERIERAARLAGELGDIRCLALCTAALADVIEGMGDSERSEKLSQDAADLLRETNEEGWLVSTLAHLALLTHRRGDDAAAERFAAEGLAISRKINYSWGIAICLSRQGRIASDAGDFPRAALLFQECLDLWHKIGDRWRITRTLGDLADMAAMMRQPERAARLLGASEVLNEPLAGSLAFADSSGWHRARREALAQLDPDTFQRAWDEGRAMSWDEAFAEAMQPIAAGNRPAAASTPPGTAADYRISPRELDVLRLLVAGRTDREIAESLYISPRTAQGHVASIFNKLGVNSRTAAVAVALQGGLLPRADGTST